MWQFSIFIGNRRKHKTTDIWRCANEDQCVPDKPGCSCRAITRGVRHARQGCWCCACRSSSPVLHESYCRITSFTNVIATCRKNFSQWESSFLWKLRCHWLKFLRRVNVSNTGPWIVGWTERTYRLYSVSSTGETVRLKWKPDIETKKSKFLLLIHCLLFTVFAILYRIRLGKYSCLPVEWRIHSAQSGLPLVR